MKRILPIVFLIGYTALTLASGKEPPATEESGPAPWKLTTDYSLKEPFSPEELRKLAAEPSKDDRRLMLLILRAGLEKTAVLCGIFNVPPLEILVALQGLQKAETERTLRLSERGMEPWSSFHARGDIVTLASDQEWLADYLTKL